VLQLGDADAGAGPDSRHACTRAHVAEPAIPRHASADGRTAASHTRAPACTSPRPAASAGRHVLPPEEESTPSVNIFQKIYTPSVNIFCPSDLK
jgi:hypothetical protein